MIMFLYVMDRVKNYNGRYLEDIDYLFFYKIKEADGDVLNLKHRHMLFSNHNGE